MKNEEDYIQERYEELLRKVNREKELFLATVEKRLYKIIDFESLNYTDVSVTISNNSKTILDSDLMLNIDIYSDEFEVRVNYDIPFNESIDKELNTIVNEYLKELNQ